VLGNLVNFVEVLALVVLPAYFLLLVDVRQEVADMLELRSFGRHARPRRLGAQPLVPGVANVERPGGGAPLEGLLGRRLGRLGLPLRAATATSGCAPQKESQLAFRSAVVRKDSSSLNLLLFSDST
jgi:hypothetical protein